MHDKLESQSAMAAIILRILAWLTLVSGFIAGYYIYTEENDAVLAIVFVFVGIAQFALYSAFSAMVGTLFYIASTNYSIEKAAKEALQTIQTMQITAKKLNQI